MRALSLLCVLCLCLATVRCMEDDGWYADPESPPQIQTLSATDFDSVVANQGVTVVHFMDSKTEDASVKKMRVVNRQMMQGAAQGADADTVFAEVDMTDNEKLCETHGVTAPNTVLVFKNGRKNMFQGYRASEVLLAFIKKVGSPVINVINNKADKKAFDKLPYTRVIGYFDSVSPAYQTFREAAEHFYPEIRFYAVLDPLVAAQIKLTTPGEVGLVRPPAKQAVLPAGPLATIEDYKTFVESAKEPLMQQISPEIFHAVLSSSGTEPFVMAFVRQMAPESKPLFKALRNLAKAQHNTVPVKLFDIYQYPMLEKQLVQKFGIDATKPALGLFNMTDGTSSWFNMSQFEAVTDKYQQMALLLDWLLDVQLGNIRVDGQPSANVPKPVINLGTEKAAEKKTDKATEVHVQEETNTEPKQEEAPIPPTGEATKKTKKVKGNKTDAENIKKKKKNNKEEGESTQNTETAKSPEEATTTNKDDEQEVTPDNKPSKTVKLPGKKNKKQKKVAKKEPEANAEDSEAVKINKKKTKKVEEQKNQKQEQKQGENVTTKKNKKKKKAEEQKGKEKKQETVDKNAVVAKKEKKQKTKKQGKNEKPIAETSGEAKEKQDTSETEEGKKVKTIKDDKHQKEEKGNKQKKETEKKNAKDENLNKKQNKKKKAAK